MIEALDMVSCSDYEMVKSWVSLDLHKEREKVYSTSNKDNKFSACTAHLQEVFRGLYWSELKTR